MKIFKKDPNFQFMNKRGMAFIFSGLVIVAGIILFYMRGFNMGIDFTGGTNIEVSFRTPTTEKQLRSALADAGLNKVMIQRVGQGMDRFFIKTISYDPAAEEPGKKGENTVPVGTDEAGEDGSHGISLVIERALMNSEELSKESAGKIDLNNVSANQVASMLVSKGVPRDVAEETGAKLVDLRKTNETLLINGFEEVEALGLKQQALSALKENAYLGSFTFLSVEMVGPQVGHDLRQKATLATVWAMIGMLIYIGFRFRFIFGVAAVVTLLHDVLVCLTFILLFQVEISLSVVAGILTIVGYSLNDTIVIFDRVRDNLKSMKRDDANVLLDTSVNQTLSRTIVTSGTTLCTVLALFFFGGEVIHAFSFTLMVGVVIGTYSSIFQSCAWLKIWEHKALGIKKK